MKNILQAAALIIIAASAIGAAAGIPPQSQRSK
jgi:hypothetical protein